MSNKHKAKLYKVLWRNGEPAHGGSGKWHLPKGKRPGKWMPQIEDPTCCRRGYHLAAAGQLLQWLSPGLVVWEAEGRGAHHDKYDKSAWAEARLVRKVGVWTEQKARLFDADCAEMVPRIDASLRAGTWAAGVAWDAAWVAVKVAQSRRLLYWLKRDLCRPGR